MAQTKPKKKSTANKRSTSKSTAKKKTTSRKPSRKPNNGKSRARTYSDTPKSKSTKTKNDDYLTIADLKQGYSKLKSNMPGYKKKGKKIAGEIVEEVAAPVLLPIAGAYYGKEYLKKKYNNHKIKKQAKKDKKKLNLSKDENGVIETDKDTKKIEPSPLDRSERIKKKRFRFF